MQKTLMTKIFVKNFRWQKCRRSTDDRFSKSICFKKDSISRNDEKFRPNTNVHEQQRKCFLRSCKSYFKENQNKCSKTLTRSGWPTTLCQHRFRFQTWLSFQGIFPQNRKNAKTTRSTCRSIDELQNIAKNQERFGIFPW